MSRKLLSRLAGAILLGAALLAPAALASHRLLTLYGAGAQTGPTKQYSFISGANTLPSDVTFTRSGATASEYNSSGTLITGIAANTPRFDYNPATLALNGLLLEQADTNLQIQSQFGSGAWGSNGISSLATNASASPDGATHGTVLTENTSGGSHAIFPNSAVSVAANTVYTFSVYLKGGTRTAAGLVYAIGGASNGEKVNVDLSAGTTSGAAAIGSGTLVGSGIQALPNGWYRVWVSGKLDSTDTSAFPTIEMENPVGTTSYTGTSATLNMYGAQVDLGPYPLSYIPTTSATVARSIDSAIISSPSWFNPAAGTLMVQAMVPAINSSRSTTIASFNDGTANNQIKIILTTSGIPEAQIMIGATAYTSGGALSPVTPGSVFQAALSYKAGSNSFAANGVQDTAGTLGAASLPTGISQLTFGDDGAKAQTLDGFEQKLKYYNTSQSNSFLLQLTSAERDDIALTMLGMEPLLRSMPSFPTIN